MPKTEATSRHFLPEFGTLRMAIGLVMLAELIAIIITIGRNDAISEQAWKDFNLLSAFAIGIALASILVLKLASPLLRRLSVPIGSVVVVLLIMLVSVIAADGLIFALHDMGFIPERWPDWRSSFLFRTVIISLIVSLLGLRYLVMQHRADMEQRSQQESRMQALQSRIRPHFLFNSLNSVAALARSDPAKAEEILHDLADLFRVLLADARKLVPIAAEREISRQYLEVEKLRLGNRLRIKWNLNNVPRNMQIPALTLQPLLENAIYHGIEPRFGGGTITIAMWGEANMLNIMISNPLPDAGRSASHARGNKIAMDNIRERLFTQFGDRATLQAFAEGDQYHVKIKIPITGEA